MAKTVLLSRTQAIKAEDGILNSELEFQVDKNLQIQNFNGELKLLSKRILNTSIPFYIPHHLLNVQLMYFCAKLKNILNLLTPSLNV